MSPWGFLGQIILEYVDGGTLTEVLGPSVPFPERCIAYVCKQVIPVALCHTSSSPASLLSIPPPSLSPDAARPGVYAPKSSIA